MTVYCIEPQDINIQDIIYIKVYMDREKPPIELVYQGYVHALRIQRQVVIKSLKLFIYWTFFIY